MIGARAECCFRTDNTARRQSIQRLPLLSNQTGCRLVTPLRNKLQKQRRSPLDRHAMRVGEISSGKLIEWDRAVG
jgi:hypothetical protein